MKSPLRFPRCVVLWTAWLGVALHAAADTAPQIPEPYRDLAGRIAQDLSRLRVDPEAVPLDSIDPQALEEIRQALVRTLSSGSLEELAPLRPYAEEALRQAETIPSLAPFAAWLRQRLDFFQVADAVTRVRPHAGDSLSESDYRIWHGKLSRRRPPSGAATLAPQLKPVFVQEGVPSEMVWLAEVESSFNPAAESPVGARGLYQFMPATAERFDLALRPHDERLDPHKSARAAARYLRFLHGKFNDWQLALAAYNAGEGRVGRLLERTGGRSFDDIAAHLPAETRMYVPKVRAVVQVREGVDLRTL